MNHPIVDVFAFQEALLIEAVFGIAILAMIWIGFRRWLQHKEEMGRLIAEQEKAKVARVEARLDAIEQMVTAGGAQIASSAPVDAQIPDAGKPDLTRR